MKNGITLLIASVLLILCVMQKEARYGAAPKGSVEKIYRSSPVSGTDKATFGNAASNALLTDSRSFEFASADTTSRKETTARLVNQSLLHISASSKMLNY